jgi:hypothetical protein
MPLTLVVVISLSLRSPSGEVHGVYNNIISLIRSLFNINVNIFRYDK